MQNKNEKKWVLLYRNATSSNVNSLKGVSPLRKGGGGSLGCRCIPIGLYQLPNTSKHQQVVYTDYSILEIPSSKKGISYRETDSQKL